jgi:hypothetical protein
MFILSFLYFFSPVDGAVENIKKTEPEIPISEFKGPDVSGLTPGEAFKEHLWACERFLATNSNIRKWIESGMHLIKGTKINDAITYVATRFGKVQISDDSKYHEWLRRFVSQSLHFQRTQAAMLANNLEIESWEKNVIIKSTKLGDLFDQFYFDWIKKVVVPFKMTVESCGLSQGQIIAKLNGAGLVNMYSVIVGIDGSTPDQYDMGNLRRYKIIPLLDAFPIIHDIRKTILELGIYMRTEEKYEYARYFLCLYLAFGCQDLDDMERVWSKVDLVWVSLPKESRIIPIHNMETGYDHPWIVIPEFKLVWRSKKGSDIILRMTSNVEKIAKEFGDEDYHNKIQRLDIAPGITLISSGSAIVFRYTGQSVPNRPAIQKIGIRTNVDILSVRNRIPMYLEMVRSCTTITTFKWLTANIGTENTLRYVAGHEAGHPVLISQLLINEFGARKSNVEELKADTLSLMASILTCTNDNERVKVSSQVIAEITANACRLLEETSFKSPHLRPYMNSMMVYVNIMKECGFMEIRNGKIHLNFDKIELIRDVFAKIEKLNMIILHAYKKRDFTALQEILDTLANPNGKWIMRVREVIDGV